MEIIYKIALIIFAFLPSVFWLIFYHYYDRKRPEPFWLILKIFIWGMLAAFLAIVLEHFLVEILKPELYVSRGWLIILRALIIVAPLEEILKFGVVRKKIYYNREFNESLDGIFYCVTAALGFAALENSLAVLVGGSQLILYRFLTTTLMHAVATGIIGYYLGWVHFHHQSQWWLIKGVILAIIFHAVFNISVSQDLVWLNLIAIPWLIAGFIFLYFKIKRFQKTGVR
ncbi:MAG: PrsW family intramembrane metalloprotease [Patescibacteria group bacterium]|jgi:RsiW-degrading membrane proteinase PrsW (M82 family)|nr:PrsW family intramembrane metalloprotease [Patescibacteria group bacterium]